jgi:hypothetical protein
MNKIRQAKQIMIDGICPEYYSGYVYESIDCNDCICFHICIKTTNIKDNNEARIEVCKKILREEKLKRILNEKLLLCKRR